MPSLSETSSPIAISDDDYNDSIVNDETLFVLKAVNVAVLTLAFDLLGSVTNILNMLVFSRIGYSDTINISLMALAVSDFGACVLLIWRTIALNPWFQQLDSLTFEPSDFSYLISTWPHIYCAKVTTLLTAFISVERCICVTRPLKVKSIVTKSKVKLFILFSFVSPGLASLLPTYLTNGYGEKFYPNLNKTLLGLVVTSNRAQIERFLYPIVNVLFSIIPFVVITVSTAFLVVSLKNNMKWKLTTKCDGNVVSPKESKVVKMVVTMSTLFILCLFPHGVALMMKAVDRDISVDGKQKNLLFAFGSFIFLLESINSSCNIFIYYHNSSVYKTTFRQIFAKDSRGA